MSFDSSWQPIKYLINTSEILEVMDICRNTKCYPDIKDIFKVFEMPVQNIKIVILGTEPLIGSNLNTGLAFSVKSYNKLTFPLYVIRQELIRSLLREEQSFDESWKTLEHWKEQGIFLLNTSLTVEEQKVKSHTKYWENFTKTVITFLSKSQNVIWFIWGNEAKKYLPYIQKPFMVDKYTIENIHFIPIGNFNYIFISDSPSNRLLVKKPFLGNNHFLFGNEILKLKKQKQINF